MSETPHSGFTLIEMMIVIAIIAILALIAMPNNHNRTVQLQVVESLDLIEIYKDHVEAAYMLSGDFPADNAAANMPDADKIKGNYLAGLQVEDGVLNLEFGQKMNEQHHGKTLSVRPVYVDADERTPLSWICGIDDIPEGMNPAGINQTDVEIEFLPVRCR